MACDEFAKQSNAHHSSVTFHCTDSCLLLNLLWFNIVLFNHLRAYRNSNWKSSCVRVVFVFSSHLPIAFFSLLSALFLEIHKNMHFPFRIFHFQSFYCIQKLSRGLIKLRTMLSPAFESYKMPKWNGCLAHGIGQSCLCFPKILTSNLHRFRISRILFHLFAP